MSTDMVKRVESLVLKAEQAEKSDDALKFSQAACNAANANLTNLQIERESKLAAH